MLFPSDMSCAEVKYVIAASQVDKRYRRMSEAPRFHGGQEVNLWVPTKNLRCRCPKMKVGASYLLLDQTDSSEPRKADGFTLAKKSSLIEWKREWARRMKRFKKRAKMYCPDQD